MCCSLNIVCSWLDAVAKQLLFFTGVHWFFWLVSMNINCVVTWTLQLKMMNEDQ